MTYAVPEPIDTRPGRPWPVTLAVTIMTLLALLSVVLAVAGYTAMNRTIDAFRTRAPADGVRPADVNQLVSAIRITFVVATILLLVFALLLGGLAWGVLQGSRPARIVTWIVCALGVLCGCCGVLSAASLGGRSISATGAVDDATRATQSMIQSYPGWYTALSGVSSGLHLLGYIATAVLLALPAANAYFRKPEPVWQPPTTQPPTTQPPPTV